METTEQVADQPQPTATTTTPSAETTAELEKHSSFLGYRPGIEVTAEQPETSADTETQQEGSETEAAPADAQQTEKDDPNWLPDDQQKVFPDDVIAKYAKRYGYTEEQIWENPGLRQLLHDKINSDIFLAKMRDGQSEEGRGTHPRNRGRDDRVTADHRPRGTAEAVLPAGREHRQADL